MSGKQKEGIDYYPVEADHVYNKKVRLLMNEFDADGYWIWNCLLCKIYKEKGYYMDMSDADELELFASDVCKKKVSLVKEVISGCVRRGLFNQTVFDMFEILTSDRIQINYLHATSERRKKGSAVTMIEDILLLEPDEEWKNITITGIKSILPGKNVKNPGKVAHSRVKYSRRKKSNSSADAPTPHWGVLVNEWFVFNEQKYGDKPSFAGQDPRCLKTIASVLEKRAADKKVEWSEQTAAARFKGFLEAAYKDAWLSSNFLLPNLQKQLDKILLNHGTHQQTPAGGAAKRGTASHAGKTIVFDKP